MKFHPLENEDGKRYLPIDEVLQLLESTKDDWERKQILEHLGGKKMSMLEALDRSGVILTLSQSLLLRPYRDCKMSLDEWLTLFERYGVAFQIH